MVLGLLKKEEDSENIVGLSQALLLSLAL